MKRKLLIIVLFVMHVVQAYKVTVINETDTWVKINVITQTSPLICDKGSFKVIIPPKFSEEQKRIDVSERLIAGMYGIKISKDNKITIDTGKCCPKAIEIIEIIGCWTKAFFGSASKRTLNAYCLVVGRDYVLGRLNDFKKVHLDVSLACYNLKFRIIKNDKGEYKIKKD